MEPAVLAAFVRAPALSEIQMRGVIGTVAALAPQLLRDLALRADLTANLRIDVVQRAPAYLVVDLLEQWLAEPSLVQAAAEHHGASAEMVVFCGKQGWIDQSVELARSLDVREADHVAARWAKVVGDVPSVVRVALIEAALTEKTPPPKLSGMPDWEQKEALERLHAERSMREQKAWRLLESVPDLWENLARNGEHAMVIRRILLNRPEHLTDEVLIACLPEVMSDQLKRGDEFYAGIRLSIAAKHIHRWPRLRDIAPDELNRLVRGVIDDGWTPTDRYLGPKWTEIVALAELTDDSGLLSDAVATTRTAEQPEPSNRQPDEMPTWSQERADAVAALAANPATSRSELRTLLPVLDEAALTAMAQHSNCELEAACHEQIDRLRQETADRQPHFVEVPSDDNLAQLDNPADELGKHLRHLRGRAAQRDTTCDGLLRSRFTTPHILRALPAFRVLASPEQAELSARMIADVCEDDTARWNAVPRRLDPLPGKTVTFGAWLDRFKDLGDHT